MKKWIVFFILISGLLAACTPAVIPSPAAPMPETAQTTATSTPVPVTPQPSPTLTQTATSTSIPTATVYRTLSPTEIWPTRKAAFAQTATAEPKPPLNWTVEVLQDGKPVTEQDGVYPVKKTHFTLRVTLPKSLFETLPFQMMMLNVSDKDENYRNVKPGSFDAERVDLEGHVPFCNKLDPDCFVFGGLAQADHSTYTLEIDQRYGWGSHHMSYTDPKHTRWVRVLFGEKDAILEQDVYVIVLDRADGKQQIIQLPYYTGEKLYLVFFMKYRAGPVVAEDELKKIVIKLE